MAHTTAAGICSSAHSGTLPRSKNEGSVKVKCNIFIIIYNRRQQKGMLEQILKRQIFVLTVRCSSSVMVAPHRLKSSVNALARMCVCGLITLTGLCSSELKKKNSHDVCSDFGRGFEPFTAEYCIKSHWKSEGCTAELIKAFLCSWRTTSSWNLFSQVLHRRKVVQWAPTAFTAPHGGCVFLAWTWVATRFQVQGSRRLSCEQTF